MDVSLGEPNSHLQKEQSPQGSHPGNGFRNVTCPCWKTNPTPTTITATPPSAPHPRYTQTEPLKEISLKFPKL